MQPPTRVELIAFALALTLAALIHLLPWMSQACEQAEWKLIIATSGPSCAEFWINRYQAAWAGLIGAAVALSAAWIAWHSIQVQIRRDEFARIEASLRQREFRVQQFNRDIATLENIQGRIHKFNNDLARSKKASLSPYAYALVRTPTPNSFGLVTQPDGRAVFDYTSWCARLQDLRSQAQVCFQQVGLDSAGAQALARLDEIEKQIDEEIAAGWEILHATATEIDEIMVRIAETQ